MKTFMKYLLITILLGWSTALLSQTSNPLVPDFAVIDYADETVYTIAEIRVVGAERRDDNAIKSIANLREGNKLVLASDELTNAVKKLLRLRIFADVSLLLDSIVSDQIYLTISIQEQPIITQLIFQNVKKGQHEKIKEALGQTLRIGGIVTDNEKMLGVAKVKEHFVQKGFLDTEVKIIERIDTSRENSVSLLFDVEKNERIKIAEIEFIGNKDIKDSKLRKQLKNTKQKKTLFKKSKFVDTDYEDDKKKLIAFYHKNGYSDAEIVSDSFWRDDKGLIHLAIIINEGVQYKIGTISWKGNTIYNDRQLSAVLGINRGEVFNPDDMQERLQFSLDGRDISSLYMDNGYLFFNIDPKQVAIRSDTIDLEMRIYEGPQATIDRVVIKGNDRTHENVIRRILRTRPGEKFSRSELVRSQREIINLGYFDPETLSMNTPVNYDRGTVDIEYTVQERPSDQLELSAGYGGFQGLIGTLGVTFNNFSIQNIRNKAAWSPLPTGDGQRLSLRLQSNSRFYRSFNFSFTEPWLGGNKPNSFSLGAAFSGFDNSSFNLGKLSITRFFAGLGTNLKFPDDFFVSSTTFNVEQLNLQDYQNQFIVSNGNFKNFNISQTISRSSITNPMFPMGGSRISLTLKFTPPYSLFRSDNFWVLSESEKAELIRGENLKRGVRDKLEGQEAISFVEDVEDSRKYEWLEYHKWRFDAEWYFNVTGKLVFMTSMKMGFLGHYNDRIGDVPFERYELGGDGLSNQNVGITGTDIVSLRGYEVQDIDPNSRRNGGGLIFNKFTAELRYPISTNPNSTIYTFIFVQGGNQWNSFRDFNPFDLKRSTGVGLRVFLPMFGLLGFDYGFGLDKVVPGEINPGLGQLGKFSIILGFEPD